MNSIKVLNFKLWLLAFSFVFFALTLSGCNGPLPSKIDFSDSVSVDSLKPQAMRIIREGLADNNPRVRTNAIEVVASTKTITLMPLVQLLLKDDFVPVRFAAALAVGDVQYRLAERQVRALLQDEDENVRIAAAYALGRLGYPENFEIIRKAAASSDQTVRANAVVLLGKTGDKNNLNLLYWALRDRDSDDRVRLQAVEAIARLGDEQIFPKLWAMLISAYADDRVMGVKAVGALGTEKAKDVLITKLDDDVLEIRLAAAEQLGMLGNTAGEQEVLKVFSEKLTADLDKQSRERVHIWTALAIGRIGTARLVKFLPQLLKDESKFVRVAAAKAVFHCTMRN